MISPDPNRGNQSNRSDGVAHQADEADDRLRQQRLQPSVSPPTVCRVCSMPCATEGYCPAATALRRFHT